MRTAEFLPVEDVLFVRASSLAWMRENTRAEKG